jgi:hypothetical protein
LRTARNRIVGILQRRLGQAPEAGREIKKKEKNNENKAATSRHVLLSAAELKKHLKSRPVWKVAWPDGLHVRSQPSRGSQTHQPEN